MRATSRINKIFRFLLCIAAIPLVSGTSYAQKTLSAKTLAVIGTATIYNDDIAKAKDRAISNSLASAIDLVVSDLLSTEAVVKNFAALNETLYVQTNKYIEGYKVLTQAKAGNLYRVKVQATVAVNKVKQQLSKIGIVLGTRAMPKILYLISEQNIGNPTPQFWWGETPMAGETLTKSTLAEILKQKGLQDMGLSMTIKKQALASLDPKQIVNTPEPDNSLALDIGRRLKAPVVIVGESSVHVAPNKIGENIMSFKGIVMARALRTDTGNEIASTFQTIVTVNADEIAGSLEALTGASRQAGEDLAMQIIDAWQRTEEKRPVVEISVEWSGNLANFVTFRRMLQNIEGIKEVQILERKADTAVLAVAFKGEAKALAEAMAKKEFDRFGIHFYEITRDSLKINLLPRNALKPE